MADNRSLNLPSNDFSVPRPPSYPWELLLSENMCGPKWFRDWWTASVNSVYLSVCWFLQLVSSSGLEASGKAGQARPQSWALSPLSFYLMSKVNSLGRRELICPLSFELPAMHVELVFWFFRSEGDRRFPPTASLLHMLIREVGEGHIPKDDANVWTDTKCYLVCVFVWNL